MAGGLGQYVVLFLAPIFYITVAMTSLGQFGALMTALSSASYHAERTPVLEPFAPILKAWVRYQEAIFGPAYKWTPNPTHVLLVALMIAVISSRKS